MGEKTLRYKKFAILSIALVFLLCVSATSATENNTDNIVSIRETTDTVINSNVEETDEIFSLEYNNQTIDSTDSQGDNLNDNSDGTFTDLANIISYSNGELKLTKNYVYDSSKDSKYKNGIKINKQITIDGKGFIINGKNNAHAFNVTASNVIIRNIEFINCYSSILGGAIYWNGINGNLFDCSFIDCNSSSSGGAIYWNGAKGNLFDCSFTNCYSSSKSYFGHTSNNVIKSSSNLGGAIYWNGDNGNISNCDFVNCKVSNHNDNRAMTTTYTTQYSSSTSGTGNSTSNSTSLGGAIYWNGINGNLYNCNFKDCFSYSFAESKTLHDHSHNIGSSNLIYSSTSYCYSYSYSRSGVYWNGNNGKVFNCNFINAPYSYASYSSKTNNENSHSIAIANSISTSFGGSVYWNGVGGNAYNCNFTGDGYNSNSGGGDGSSSASSQKSRSGDINWKGSAGSLFNCNFINVDPTKKSIYWDGIDGMMYNVSFGDYGGINPYESRSSKSSIAIIRPVISIYTSSINTDDGIIIFESTQLSKNISVKIYNVTNKKTLCNEFNISYKDLSLLNLNDLGGGEYQIVLEYPGDTFYTATSTNNLFKISKTPSYEITMNENLLVGDNVSINLTLNEDATGRVRITVNDYTCINSLVDGKTSFNIPNVRNGTNTFKIKYEGNENYNPIYLTDTFKVLLKSNISLNLKEKIVFDENIALTYTITPNCTGIISVIVDNVFKANISVGEQFELEAIPTGEHNITVIYNGDDFYFTSKDSTKLTVSKADPSITVNFSNIPGTVTFEVILNEKATGNVNVTLDNNSYYKTITEGKYNIIIPNLNAGTYSARVYYEGDNNYNDKIYNEIVIINKIPTDIMGTVNDITYSENALINVKGSVEGIAVVKIDNTYFNNVNIMANTVTPINFENIPTGKHDVTITLKPTNTNYAESTYTTEFTVSKKQTSIIGTVNDITYSENALINVKGSVEGIAVVKIDNTYFNNVNIMANTVTPINFENIPTGKHDVTITLKPANTNYAESTYTTEFTVSKKETSVNLEVIDSEYGKNVIVNVTASEDGKVIVNVGDITREKNILANVQTTINFGVLAANSYDAKVTFNAGDNYKIATKQKSFTVTPAISEIVSLQVQNNTYGENTIINVKTNVVGVLSIKINNNIKIFDITANKLTTLDLGKYDSENYIIDLTLDAGSNYTKATANAKITVNPKQTTVKVNVNDNVYDKNIIVNITASENGKVTVYMGTNVKSIDVEANKVSSVNFGILDVKSYEVNATFDGGKNYQTSSDKTLLVITPKSTSITLNTKNYDTTEKVIVNVTASENGKATIKVGDLVKTIYITANIITSIDFGILDVGSYNIVGNFTAGNNYMDSNATGNFKVLSKIKDEDVNIEIPETISNKDNEIVIKLPADATGIVTLIIRNNSYQYTVKEGVVDIKVPLLNDGNYNYEIKYSGDSKYSSFTKTGNLNIHKLTPTIITTSAVTTVYNGNKFLVVTLTDSQGIPVSGVTLSFNLNGFKTTSTATNGQAKLTTNGLAPKVYLATIIFAGNNNYEKISTSVKVTVKKATPKITAKTKTFKRTLKTKKYSITLKTNQNKVMKNTKVTIKVNKKTYAAKTNKKGVATFKITKLTKKGTFKAVITYKGDSYYNKVTKKVNIKCK